MARMSPKPKSTWIKRVRRVLRELLDECSGDYYDLFDYLRQVKIDAKQIRIDYGSHAAFDLNCKCGAIVKCGGGVRLDCIADEQGFESVNEFWQYLQDYKPKYKWARELAEHILDEFEELDGYV